MPPDRNQHTKDGIACGKTEDAGAVPLRERLAASRAEYPLPPPTGEKADKAFFDALSGEPDAPNLRRPDETQAKVSGSK